MIEKVSIGPDEPGEEHRDFRDLMERILDNGLSVDAGNRLEMMAAEPLDLENRVVVASVETHFRLERY